MISRYGYYQLSARPDEMPSVVVLPLGKEMDRPLNITKDMVIPVYPCTRFFLCRIVHMDKPVLLICFHIYLHKCIFAISEGRMADGPSPLFIALHIDVH